MKNPVKYYVIKSCFERINNDTQQNEVMIIANELKWKNLLSSFNQYFFLTPEDFVAKFWSLIKNDEFNKWLTGVNLEVEIEIHRNLLGVANNIPDDLK